MKISLGAADFAAIIIAIIFSIICIVVKLPPV